MSDIYQVSVVGAAVVLITALALTGVDGCGRSYSLPVTKGPRYLESWNVDFENECWVIYSTKRPRVEVDPADGVPKIARDKLGDVVTTTDYRTERKDGGGCDLEYKR